MEINQFTHKGRVTHTDPHNESLMAFSHAAEKLCQAFTSNAHSRPRTRLDPLGFTADSPPRAQHRPGVFRPPKASTGRGSVHQRSGNIQAGAAAGSRRVRGCMFDVTSGVKGHKSAVASRRGSHKLDMLGISGGRKCNSESL